MPHRVSSGIDVNRFGPIAGLSIVDDDLSSIRAAYALPMARGTAMCPAPRNAAGDASRMGRRSSTAAGRVVPAAVGARSRQDMPPHPRRA